MRLWVLLLLLCGAFTRSALADGAEEYVRFKCEPKLGRASVETLVVYDDPDANNGEENKNGDIRLDSSMTDETRKQRCRLGNDVMEIAIWYDPMRPRDNNVDASINGKRVTSLNFNPEQKSLFSVRRENKKLWVSVLNPPIFSRIGAEPKIKTWEWK
ncbi:hypothetical protein [Bradyrhizobium sp. CCGUVB14]|uniref:hypothetical protein n=1 Tax=Bradyrhizobium sp. CCGUVB14 TaxID=2949628 RepID=UPI0020B17BA9|nr:hypothetical protein [Bradyrhizobium sp. CCGUVB14]MCP3447327.1 hypothetical protein [Bradyrhizobium sp. CCGUVB14]